MRTILCPGSVVEEPAAHWVNGMLGRSEWSSKELEDFLHHDLLDIHACARQVRCRVVQTQSDSCCVGFVVCILQEH